MSVLGHTPLGYIQIAKYLDTGYQGIVYVLLQLHYIRDDTVQTHTHGSVCLKGLYMDIGHIGVVSSDDQAVQQVDYGGVVIGILHVNLHHLFGKCRSLCRLIRGLPCADLRIIILYRILYLGFFTQLYHQLGPGHLPHVLYAVEIQGIVHKYIKVGFVLGKRQHAILLGKCLRYALYGLDIHIDIPGVYHLMSEPAAEGIQHLTFIDKAQGYKGTSHEHALVLLLVFYSLAYLLVGNVAEFLQHVTYPYGISSFKFHIPYSSSPASVWSHIYIIRFRFSTVVVTIIGSRSSSSVPSPSPSSPPSTASGASVSSSMEKSL